MIRDSNIVTGAVTAMIAVSLGAFGAHLLEPVLEAAGRSGTWQTAVEYHFYHSLAILVAALLLNHFSNRNIQRAIYCFILGIVLFSGSLYILSLTDLTALAMITPAGGVFFILGWLLLALGAIKK